MDVHEFQAKELLSRFGLQIPDGRVAGNAEDAKKMAAQMSAPRFAVKAQIHAGGRGPRGGVRFADDAAGVAKAAAGLIGSRLVTAQTGPAGQIVRWVYIEEAIDIARELYFALTVDRGAGKVVALASAEGSTDIEARAQINPKLIERETVELTDAGPVADFGSLTKRIGLGGVVAERAEKLFNGLARAFVELDAGLVEINPLAVTAGGDLIALDAKIVLDDNALFRHLELTRLRHLNENECGDPVMLEAEERQINYMAMDGDIGVVVNGAGLALATLDTIADAGGRAANFMDVRPTATSLDIAYGFNLIVSNPKTQVALVNIHGGGMQRCDKVAEGIAISMRRAGRTIPVVIRMAGNNADFARTVLDNAGINYVDTADMGEAAARAVELATGRRA